jgi:HEAT repeat protein
MAAQVGLRSDDPAEREAAEEAVAQDGALLRRLVKDADPEVASRASRRLRRLEFRQAVGRGFQECHRDLVGDSENDWTSAYLWMMGRNDVKRMGLFARARRGVETFPELKTLVEDALGNHIEEALPDLLELLDDREHSSRIYGGLRRWKPEVAQAALERRLASDEVEVRRRALATVMSQAGWLFDAVAERLLDPDAEVRRLAVLVLGQGGDRRALEASLDEDAGVRRAALYSIAYLRAEDRATDVLEALGDADPETRGTAAHVAASLGLAEAFPRLVRMLEDEETRGDAMSAIVGLRPGREMVALTRHDDGAIATWAIDVLKEMLSAPEAGTLLADPNLRVRHAALRALQRVEAPVHPIVLAVLARDADEAIRDMALGMIVLAGTGTEEQMRRALTSDRRELRAFAVRHGDEQFAELVEERVSDESRDVRMWLLVRDTLGLETLVQLAWDVDLQIAKDAIQRLKGIDNARAILELGRMILDALPERRELAWRSVDNDVAPVVLEGFRSKDAGIRERAVRAFARVRDEATREALVEAFRDRDAGVRQAAKEVAAWERSAADGMKELLEDPATRRDALDVIAATSAWDHLDRLIDLAGDRDGAVRLRVAKALGLVDAERSRGALKKLATDSDEGVRFAAIEGLVMLEGIDWARALLESGRSLNALNVLRHDYEWRCFAQGPVGEAENLLEGGAVAGALTVGEGLERAGLDVTRVEGEWRVIPRDEARKAWQAWLKAQTK